MSIVAESTYRGRSRHKARLGPSLGSSVGVSAVDAHAPSLFPEPPEIRGRGPCLVVSRALPLRRNR